MLGHQGPNSALRPETQPPSALLRFLICIKWMIIIWGGVVEKFKRVKMASSQHTQHLAPRECSAQLFPYAGG